MRQFKFAFANDYKKEFGGSKLLGKRKSARPISTKSPMHLILKSNKFKPFDPTNYQIVKIIKAHANKYQISLHNFAVNHSHIHLAIKLPTRQAYYAFIKTLTAALVKFLSKILKMDLKGLFDLRPFTRILSWGRDFERVLEYMILNQQEALGLIKRVKKIVKPKKLVM